MSGQRNNKPMDASKARQAYMANLALEANINDKNLQANKIFIKTGVTPSQPTDSRTTSEKLADIQRLKIDVRSSLSEICDGQNADEVVNNLDGAELVFVAQHIQEIIKEIKPKYKYGVPADVLVDFINAYMEKAQETNEVEYGLQQRTGQQLILSNQQILRDMIGPQDLLNLSNLIGRNADFMNRQLVEAIKRDIQTLYVLLPKEQDLRDLTQTIDANTRYRLQQELNDALADVAVKGQINDLARQLQLASSNSDAQRANEIASVIHSILQLDPASQEQLQRFKAEMRESLGDIASNVADLSLSVDRSRDQLEALESGLYGLTEQTQEEIKDALRNMGVESVAVLNRVSNQLSRELKDMSAQQADDIVQAVLVKLSMKVDERGNLAKGDVAEATASAIDELGGGALIPAKALPQKDISEAQKIGLRNLIRPSKDFVNTGFKNERHVLYNYCREVQRLIPERYQPKTAQQLGLPKGKSLTNATFTELLEVAKRLNEVADELLNHSGKFSSGYGLKRRITGKGLSRQERENVLTKTDFSKGIMPQEKYIPFGKHYIDQHRINDDIVNIKRHNGVNITGIPVRRVSKHLGEVMRTIIGHGIPSYNQIDKLTKEEKNYLHKIAKSSDLLDRLHIPSPTKEEDDQDVNEFEVLKGEILCGNDGSETIKKFKLIIMRMMNKGLLPKGQGKEILVDLATLGH